MTTVRLPNVTIRLNAVEDLAAANLDTAAADQFTRAYRAAAEAICDGIAEVAVVAADYDAGCDAAWAQEFGLWQAAHDCLARYARRGEANNVRWCVSDHHVELRRAALSVWMVRNVPGAAAALGCPD